MNPVESYLAKHPERANRLRWKVFLRDGRCKICSLEITGVNRWIEDGTPYAVKNGEMILFNIDHIIPRSYNGSSTLGNLRTTCVPCNEKRQVDPPVIVDGVEVPSDYELKILQRIYNKDTSENLEDWEPYYGF